MFGVRHSLIALYSQLSSNLETDELVLCHTIGTQLSERIFEEAHAFVKRQGSPHSCNFLTTPSEKIVANLFFNNEIGFNNLIEDVLIEFGSLGPNTLLENITPILTSQYL